MNELAGCEMKNSNWHLATVGGNRGRVIGAVTAWGVCVVSKEDRWNLVCCHGGAQTQCGQLFQLS